MAEDEEMNTNSVYNESDEPETATIHDGLGNAISNVSIGSFTSSSTWPTASASEYGTLTAYEPELAKVSDGIKFPDSRATPGSLVTTFDEENSRVVTRISGTSIVQGAGNDALEATEDLVESIRAFLDCVYGANSDSPPTLVPEFLDEVKKLETWSKALGLLTT